MPHNKDTPIEVIQADRDAAADLAEWLQGITNIGGNDVAAIRNGIWDQDGDDLGPLVQAFARHRLAHSPTPIDPSDEQVERDPRLSALADRLQVIVSLGSGQVPHDDDLEREVLWHVNCLMAGDSGHTFLRSHRAAIRLIAQLLRFNCRVGENVAALRSPVPRELREARIAAFEEAARVAERDRRTTMAISVGYEPAFHTAGKNIAAEIRHLIQKERSQ